MSDSIPLSAPDVQPDDRLAVMDVLEGSQLSRGPRLGALETLLAERCGRQYGVGVSSGTAALHCALAASGVGPDDEVLLPSFTVPACVNAVIAVGAKPVFIDIDAHTLALCPKDVQTNITERARAVIMVHPFGHPADAHSLVALCESHQLTLIEDACEAIGGKIADRPIGSFGHASVFGFYPNKQITAGEGGAVLCDDENFARAIRRWRNQGRAMNGRWLDQDAFGLNYRLSELNAALAMSQLSRLDDVLQRRTDVAERYDAALRELPLVLPPRMPDMSWFCYVVQLGIEHDRNATLARMAAAGIQCGRYFAPLHQQPFAASLGSTRKLPVTESVAERTLALPFYNALTAAHQHRVCATLAELLS